MYVGHRTEPWEHMFVSLHANPPIGHERLPGRVWHRAQRAKRVVASDFERPAVPEGRASRRSP
jgi:hypothetical protein